LVGKFCGGCVDLKYASSLTATGVDQGRGWGGPGTGLGWARDGAGVDTAFISYSCERYR